MKANPCEMQTVSITFSPTQADISLVVQDMVIVFRYLAVIAKLGRRTLVSLKVPPEALPHSKESSCSNDQHFQFHVAVGNCL